MVHQLVADGIDNSTFDLYNEPTYLTPEEWHNELSSLSKPPILIDMRNHYERYGDMFQVAASVP